jgi:hypothetical protein
MNEVEFLVYRLLLKRYASKSSQSRDEGSQRYDADNIHLLSIGTGRAQFSLAPPGADAGLLYWTLRVAEVMGTSQIQGIYLPLKFLFGRPISAY